jgi:hypothetical protein
MLQRSVVYLALKLFKMLPFLEGKLLTKKNQNKILRKIWTILDKLSKFQEIWGTRTIGQRKIFKSWIFSHFVSQTRFFALFQINLMHARMFA